MNNADLPAMPQPNTVHENGEIEYGYPGLSKREYFAGLAMQGLLANARVSEIMNDLASYSDLLSKDCYTMIAIEHADSLLANLEKTK